MKVRYAAREWLRTLCLLSTFVPASRCRRTNDAALSSEGHFFVVACYCFEGGLTRPTFILERQRRTPTKGRIQNTPKLKWEVTSSKRQETDGKGALVWIGMRPIKEREKDGAHIFADRKGRVRHRRRDCRGLFIGAAWRVFGLSPTARARHR